MSEHNPIYDFLKDSKGVIHIGASVGQERDIYASMNLPVIWIEAIPEVYEQLKKYIEFNKDQKAYNYLITDKNEPNLVKFNIANNSWSSSIFKLLKHKEVWPEVEFNDDLIIHQYTLPHMLIAEGIDLSQYDTLILDVQGAELLVLQGAKEILSNFKFIRCEATNAELYEGQCLDHQLTRWLSQHGFRMTTTWEMAESTDQIGIFEILYQNEKSIKNARVIDPVTGKEGLVKVGVVTSNPRLGFQVHASTVFMAFGKTGWPINRVAGAFWEQSMQNGLNNLINYFGCDYIITLDYDSLFTPEDVQNLVSLAFRYPEADCISAWQLKRHDGVPTALMGWWNEEENKFSEFIPNEVKTEEITKVDHTVFGLTLLKTEALLKVPKPWFQSFPNADGEWLEGKVDADGYFFRKWKEYGNTIYCANDVKIGHLEEVVLWIDNDFTPIRQSVSQYHKTGRPF